jgi:hypothetical protein
MLNESQSESWQRMNEPENSEPENNKPEKDSRKPYEPPALASISLRPEEAVLGACKSSSIAGPVHTRCTTIPSCKVNGS